MLDKGTLLFRNLDYFRGIEDISRGDSYEGTHLDRADKEVVIKNLNTGMKVHGNFSFLNSINHRKVFVFCLSRAFDKKLLVDFGSDVCIEIRDTEELVRRVRRQVMNRISLDRETGLIAKPVTYYDSTTKELNLRDARMIPFLKRDFYSTQQEYRLCFGKRGAFQISGKIVQPTFKANSESMFQESLKIEIGSIRDIASVVSF